MKLAALFSPRLVRNLVYMLQSSGYSVRDYLAWFWRVPDISKVMYRKSLDLTPKAKLLILVGWAAVGAQLLHIAWLLLVADSGWQRLSGVGWLLLLPNITAHLLPLVAKIGTFIIQKPKEGQILSAAHQKFSNSPAIKIAVAGSYGKTTMKDVLATVIAKGKKVAVSPGNLNTPLGLAEFAKALNGEEEVIVLEFGESHPGDITELCKLTLPNYGIITGINEAHLSTMGSLASAGDTVFELADWLGPDHIIGNGDNNEVKRRASKKMQLYGINGVGKWKTNDIVADLSGTRFSLKKGTKKVKVDTMLLGQHQVGPLCAVVDVADALGLSVKQIESGLSDTKAFEHRFQKLDLHGAVIIDDTYNGNIDGMKAGIDFAKSVTAERKIYVTPGLVDTASQKARLHKDIGKRASGVFDVVVLMKNSNAPFIKQGLEKGRFKGELKEIDDPLGFYQNLESFVAKGDLVLLQNDLTDNYS